MAREVAPAQEQTKNRLANKTTTRVFEKRSEQSQVKYILPLWNLKSKSQWQVVSLVGEFELKFMRLTKG